MCFCILSVPFSRLVQHLPFHRLPMELGPLHRVGSNMLSIRQLQCLPGVNLSYALVNAVGVSGFSEPQEQCFYGEGEDPNNQKIPAPMSSSCCILLVHTGFLVSPASI